MTGETVLAFDFGEKRIGVAVGNSVTRTARPLAIVSAATDDARFAQIAELIKTWQPNRMVVGVPRGDDGAPERTTALAVRFAHRLAGRFNLPVVEVDERYSSVAAGVRQREARQAGAERHSISKRGGIDDLAAQIILESYFDEPGT